jgi:hypothetical protein
MLRTWVKTSQSSSQSSSSQSKVIFYDSGDYWGEYYDDETWVCYKILSRKKSADGIEETLERMYDDFVPWDVFSTEEYTILERTANSLEIPGWRLTFHQ